jgi:hypothetical protein
MMNERIKELAKQAGLINRRFMFGQYYEDELTDEQKKFAELIVRECMVVTKDYTCNQGWDYSAPVALARHFGVRE